MGYFKDTIKGVSWMGALRGATRVVAFLKIAILARLLTPTQFGVFGIGLLVLSFLEIMTDTGVNVFLIQENAELSKYLNTAWVVSIARGALISLFILLSAPLVSAFFNSPESYRVLMLTSLIPLVRGFINPAVVRFQKELLFAKEFSFRFLIFAIDGAVAILAAFITHSAISLIYGLLAGSIFEMLFSQVFIKPRPAFAFDSGKAKEIVGRGKWVTAAGIFNYLYENGDNVVVGRILDAASLGLYQTAYRISSLPITEIADVVSRVTFPVYVKISGDMARLKKAYIKTLAAITLAVLPIGVILLFFTEPVVQIVLGDKWLGTVGVIKVLSFLGVIRAITMTANPLFLSVKKQEYVMSVTLVGILGLAITIVPLVRSYGIVGAGFSAIIGALTTVPVTFYFVYKFFAKT